MALSALATAAVSFAVVDVSTSIGKSCGTTPAPCAHEAVPVIAITFAALGVLSLLIGIVPAVLWMIASIQANRHASEQQDAELARDHRRALRGDDSFLDEHPPNDDDDRHDDEPPAAGGMFGLGPR